jgi:chromosome segregation ATPase
VSTDSSADRRFHELVRYAYVEHLLAQRRILVLGGLTRATCERLAELHARFVVGVTDDEDLADELADDETPANVTYQSMSLGSLNFRDGSFDVVVVPDLSALEEPEQALREARRVLTPEGVALISLANREATGGLAGVEPPEVGYTELFEICSNVWSIVRMVGQSPFVGYVVADFAPEDEEPSISFDASLAPDEGEEVEFYLAICGDEPVEIDPYAIVQMPLAAVVPQEVDTRASDAEVDELREAADREKERSVEHGLRAQRLEHELKAMADEAAKGRDRAARFARELEEEKKARQRAEIEGQMARRSPELAELRERVSALTADLEAARAAAAERDRERSRAAEHAAWEKEHQRLEGELGHLHEELEAAERARLEAEALAGRAQTQAKTAVDERRRDQQAQNANVVQRDARIAALEAEIEALPKPTQLEALAFKVKALEEQVTLLRAAVDEADGERGRDLGRIEDELRQRVRRIVELEAEVARREAIVRDLCAQLEDSSRALPEIAEAARERQAELDAARAAMEAAVERADMVEGELAVEIGRAAALGTRIAALEDERQAGQWRIDELQSRVAAAGQGLVEVDVAAAMTRGYRMRIAELEHEISGTLEIDPRLQPELDRALARLLEVESELSACRHRGEELAQRLAECQDRRRDQGDSARRAGERITELEGTLQARDARTRELEGTIEARDARVRELGGTMGRLEPYARELEAEIAVQRSRSADLEAAVAAARAEAQEVSGRFQASETDASFARHIATIAQEELLELRSILTIRDAQLAELEGARRGFSVRARELEVEEGERRTIEADLTGHISQLETKLDEVQRRFDAAVAVRLESEGRTLEAEAREHEGTAAVRRLMEENEAQRLRLREALERGDVLLAELEARQGDVVDARRDRQSIESTAGDLRRRLEESGAERETLRGEVDGARRIRQDLEFRVEARERELAEVRAAHASLEGDFRSARGAAESRSQELSEARRTGADAELVTGELRALIDAAHRETVEARSEATRESEAAGALRRDLEAESLVVEELRAELSTRGDDIVRASNGASQEVQRLREQIRGLEVAAEEMASRGAVAIADAEERGVAVRQGLDAQVERLRRELADARRPVAEPEADAIRAELARARDELGRVREEASGSEVMLRSLMAQIEERDGRIALLERHSMEEGQRAESTMRGYDDRMLQMTEELMTLRSEHSAAQREVMTLRGGDGARDPRDTDPLGPAVAIVEAEAMRATLDAVRRELSRLSEDPRGQPILEELRALMRRVRS